jgi:hypothetical protein
MSMSIKKMGSHALKRQTVNHISAHIDNMVTGAMNIAPRIEIRA